ncbi:MAG: hypothetical protein LC802_19285 [Acidobacteria bacterium]|nr:hypothetical protein [Acidobacteriota bacterium]
MGELDEKLWAVISERGCEAMRVAHAEAVELMRRLKAEKLSGLCVITSQAASRLQPAEKKDGGDGGGEDASGNNSKRQRRMAKNKRAT